MPRKADRRVEMPPGVVPLLTQAQLETYYDVSDWTVLRWIELGMPVEPVRPTDERERSRVHRRFDLTAVRAWHAKHPELTAAEAPQTVGASSA